MNIRQAILKVFSANFLQLISSLIVGFFVPAILSIDGYASLKTYTLYISYIAFLNLGFVDGIYLKYGGKTLETIDKGVLKGEHKFLFVFQLFVTIIVFLVSIILKNLILFMFSISILPIMMQGFFKNLYQATGNFDKYSKIMYLYTVSYMILNILLALVFRCENYILYCLTTFGANLISVIIFEIKFLSEYKNEKTTITKEVFNNIKSGFFILLGNISVVALFGIDKWFVKLFLTVEDFAYYSFAVAMLNIINVLINAISITFYNYLFENKSEEKINKLKKYLVSLGGFASIGYFALAFIVNCFIKKYIPSLNIVAITFAIFPYMILINSLYVNLYKVNRNEKKYFKVVITMLFVSIIYNLIAVLIFKNSLAIAFTTILTLITWVIYSSNDLESVKNDKKIYIYCFFLTTLFLFCAHLKNIWMGAAIYFIVYICITYVFNIDVYLDLKRMIVKKLKK